MIVQSRYSIFPPEGEQDPKLSGDAYVQYVKDAVAGLTLSGDFMHNGKDSNVCIRLLSCIITD